MFQHQFLWFPIFVFIVYILIIDIFFLTRCVGVVKRMLDCHQRYPSSIPSSTKSFWKKIHLENSLKLTSSSLKKIIWGVLQIWLFLILTLAALSLYNLKIFSTKSPKPNTSQYRSFWSLTSFNKSYLKTAIIIGYQNKRWDAIGLMSI